ncbi:MAG TPA: hypothetical protein VJ904_04055, partial [Tichowtungia sp.]|nr:hypothetical protein [Tichowtungia sp.]
TGLATIAGNGAVSLNWNENAEADLAGYSVYRSTTQGSYGAALTNGLNSSSFMDLTVVNGTVYYYTVTASDINGNESPQSAEVSATPEGSAAFSDVTVFGSDNDGWGGFTQSDIATDGADPYNSWVLEADSARFTESTTPGDGNGGLHNNSLLKLFEIDRSIGSAYTITGTLAWSAEADRNNRQGIYLFGDYDNVTTGDNEDEFGALSLQYQADNQVMRISEGLDSGETGFVKDLSPANAPAVNSYFTDLQFTFKAEIAFINTNGTDEIDIVYNLIDEFGGSPATNTLSIVVNAADYTGDYFGFAGRTRNDGAGDSVARYKTFSIETPDGGPEPTGYNQWAAAYGVGAAANDFDGDGLNNLFEYGLGGNPTNGLVPVNLPVFSKSGNRFLYVHPQRSDDASLIYTVETTTNLLSGAWIGAGYMVMGTNVTGGELDFVTNEVDTVADEKYIRLKIEQ